MNTSTSSTNEPEPIKTELGLETIDVWCMLRCRDLTSLFQVVALEPPGDESTLQHEFHHPHFTHETVSQANDTDESLATAVEHAVDSKDGSRMILAPLSEVAAASQHFRIDTINSTAVPHVLDDDVGLLERLI